MNDDRVNVCPMCNSDRFILKTVRPLRVREDGSTYLDGDPELERYTHLHCADCGSGIGVYLDIHNETTVQLASSV
jgi:DNA-directed RNA polymerase subunit RPC12/RpoP